MTDLITIDQGAALAARARTLDGLVEAWLQAKHNRSKSNLTRRDYKTALASFRAWLGRVNLDLDGPVNQLAFVAQTWAAAGGVAAPTHNKRLAIVSSFYDYAIKHSALADNPIQACERPPVQRYANSKAIASPKAALASIDQSTPAGARDYAIIAVTLQTGRRLAEIAALRWADVHQDGDQITLTFPRAKGNKVMRDTLPPTTSRALMRYLQQAYGAELGSLAPDAPIWRSLSRNNAGGALKARAIQAICKQHTGAHFHALRHTFAQSMEKAGAKLTETQQRLGHSNPATTGLYLAALTKNENPHADKLATLFGIE